MRAQSLVRICDNCQQIDLTKEMTRALLETGRLDYDVLLEYCKTLRNCNVYSNQATDIVTQLIGTGIACKCVGGLYDKAILVLHPTVCSKTDCEEFIIAHHNHVVIVE